MSAYTFKLLGELVTIEVNATSDHRAVTFGDTLIADETGEVIDWGDLWTLTGAAREAKERQILRESAEAAVRDFIFFAAGELSER